jgi:hypothetical protein
VDCARQHPFLRFLFAVELSETCATEPQDDDIDRCLWVTADEILNAPNLRSPLVAESIRCWQSGAACRWMSSAHLTGRLQRVPMVGA